MCRRNNRYQRYFVSSCLEKKILYSRGGGSTVYILSTKQTTGQSSECDSSWCIRIKRRNIGINLVLLGHELYAAIVVVGAVGCRVFFPTDTRHFVEGGRQGNGRVLPPILSTCPLHTSSGCGKEKRILIGPWRCKGSTRYWNSFRVYWNPLSKHQIQPEYGDEQTDAGRDCRTRLARPNSQARTGTVKY